MATPATPPEDTRILTPEQIAHMRNWLLPSPNDRPLEALLASHEALREQLAEAEILIRNLAESASVYCSDQDAQHIIKEMQKQRVVLREQLAKMRERGEE